MPLTVSEIFASIEGETSWVGTPTTFVRLTGCNLRCGYCDTEYAFQGGRTMTLEALSEQASDWKTPLVCITGGEPLLQEDCPALISAMCDRGFTVLVETSGSRDIGVVDPRAITILDVKTPGSGEFDANRWENLDQLRPQDELKLVLTGRDDYEWARAFVTDRSLGARPVFFNPAWGELDPKDLASWILADRLPVRMGLQIHKYVWGPEVAGV